MYGKWEVTEYGIIWFFSCFRNIALHELSSVRSTYGKSHHSSFNFASVANFLFFSVIHNLMQQARVAICLKWVN